ncbi:MAG: VWA domain-containing protein [Thermoanaerobaculia bacterium]|nr:VWA domain-containing protein [Thermoanaerobaculia bacterium]
MRSAANPVSARRLLAIAVLLAAGTLLPALGQEPEAQPEPFAERVEVEVVNVDVIVTDREKRRVLDLNEDDFELLVDGRPVPIEYFAAPRLPAAPAIAAESLALLPVAPSPLPEPIPPANLILYVDQTALENRARFETVRELREFLRARSASGDRVMVAAFEQDLRVLLLPTSDPAAIAQALDELENRPSLARLGSGEKRQLEQDIRAYGRNRMRLSGASAELRGARMQQSEIFRLENEITNWAEQQIDRERRSIVALERLVGALGAAEGRKAVVLATAGIQAFPARGLFAALDQQRQLVISTEADRAPTLELRGIEVLREFEQMVRAAQNARVAFYTVSPVVQPPAENSAEFGSAGPGEAAAKPLPRDMATVEAASSIARMAGATGGASYNIGDDLDRRLEAVTADIDAAYSLGFSTGAAAGDKDHKIEVRTRRADLEVRHRESFKRREAPERAESALAAAVTFGQAENPLEITLKVGVGKSEGKKNSGQVVPLAVGIPLRFVTLVPEGEVRNGRVSVRMAIQDPQGRMLESTAAIVPIVVPEAQMAKAMASSWYHRAEMRLAPGPQRVAVVVLDEVSGLQSTTFVELEIPEAN